MLQSEITGFNPTDGYNVAQNRLNYSGSMNCRSSDHPHILKTEKYAQTTDPNINKTSSEVKRFLNSVNKSLSFSIDEQTGESVITVTEKETGKVIRQIPQVEMRKLSIRMKQITGIIFNKEM
ncbi:MAG: hypothetical protein GWO85_00520 [Simkaniaceae bacterium]|nr:hypothetical protein [Simkaniaceae bacterium]